MAMWSIMSPIWPNPIFHPTENTTPMVIDAKWWLSTSRTRTACVKWWEAGDDRDRAGAVSAATAVRMIRGRKNMKRIILKRGKITAIHDTTINCLEAQDIQQSSAKLLEFLAAKIHHQSPVIGRGTVGRGVFWQSFDHNAIKSWNRIMEIGLGSSHCPPWQAVQLAEFLENFCPPMFTPHEGNWGKMRKNGGKWGKSLSWPNHLKKSCQLHRWFFVAIGRGQSNFHDSIPWSEWEIHR